MPAARSMRHGLDAKSIPYGNRRIRRRLFPVRFLFISAAAWIVMPTFLESCRVLLARHLGSEVFSSVEIAGGGGKLLGEHWGLNRQPAG